MTATNHVVTGVFIASVVHNPAIAMPAALMSHFVCDALPHFGAPIKTTGLKFNIILATDATIAAIILLSILYLGLPNSWILIFGGVLAASPDLMWLPEYISAIKGKPRPTYGPLRRFHSNIQWYQKPNGALVEGVWFLAMFIITFAITVA